MPAYPRQRREAGPEENLRDNHARIRRELVRDAKKLAALVDAESIAPPGGRFDDAGHFMNRVGEDCETKRLFICCDGTGNNASGTVDPLTNVAKLARAVHRIGEDLYKVPDQREALNFPHGDPEERRFGGVRQIVYYSSGVGTRSALSSDSLYAAAFGKGLIANLLDAYCFICNNYNGRSCADEIILAGFSRGAFTVRCLAQFINDVGLLRRSGLVFLQTVFRLWRKNAGYKPDPEMLRERWPESYRNFQLARDALTRDFCSGEHGAVRVKVLAEWDTVSAMGLLRGNSLSFVGNKVPGNVDNAFLAVSLHEKRNMFQPMLWDSKENRGTKTNIKQCIFAGCHSDIGGGNADPALSAASFFWMIGQINGCCKADFSHESTTFQYVTPLQVEKSWWAWNRPPVGLHIQSFAEGRVNESRRGWWAVPYWLFLSLWDGKRDSLWEKFLKKTDRADEDRNVDPVDLTVHVTVRLLYENRYRVPAVENGDHRLQCGLFKRYRPEGPGQGPGEKRWVKRGTIPKRFLNEDIMGEDEKKLFRTLLWQANQLKEWSPDERLEDQNNDCNWTELNYALKWDPIIKGCSYEQTFISMLEDLLWAPADWIERLDKTHFPDAGIEYMDQRMNELGRFLGSNLNGFHSNLDELVPHPRQPPSRRVRETVREGFASPDGVPGGTPQPWRLRFRGLPAPSRRRPHGQPARAPSSTDGVNGSGEESLSSLHLRSLFGEQGE